MDSDIIWPDKAIAYKFADPTEGDKFLFTEAEIAEIEREDPGLILRKETDELLKSEERL